MNHSKTWLDLVWHKVKTTTTVTLLPAYSDLRWQSSPIHKALNLVSLSLEGFHPLVPCSLFRSSEGASCSTLYCLSISLGEKLRGPRKQVQLPFLPCTSNTVLCGSALQMLCGTQHKPPTFRLCTCWNLHGTQKVKEHPGVSEQYLRGWEECLPSLLVGRGNYRPEGTDWRAEKASPSVFIRQSVCINRQGWHRERRCSCREILLSRGQSAS